MPPPEGQASSVPGELAESGLLYRIGSAEVRLRTRGFKSLTLRQI